MSARIYQVRGSRHTNCEVVQVGAAGLEYTHGPVTVLAQPCCESEACCAAAYIDGESTVSAVSRFSWSLNSPTIMKSKAWSLTCSREADMVRCEIGKQIVRCGVGPQRACYIYFVHPWRGSRTDKLNIRALRGASIVSKSRVNTILGRLACPPPRMCQRAHIRRRAL